jgi:hypothetical protein
MHGARLTDPADPVGFSDLIRFDGAACKAVPDEPGVYIIYDTDIVLYVGMAGTRRNWEPPKAIEGPLLRTGGQHVCPVPVSCARPVQVG